MLALRRPADPAFLARRIAVANRLDRAPRAGSRRWLVATCRAELEWALADWRRLGGLETVWGAHPSEAARLPHEHAAAALVGCHLHADAERWSAAEVRTALERQVAAACDATLSDDHRRAWSERACASRAQLQVCHRRLRQALRAFRIAADHYARLRREVDVANTLAFARVRRRQ